MENLQLVLPEIFLSLSIMFLLIFGVFKKNSSRLVQSLSLAVLIVTAVITFNETIGINETKKKLSACETQFSCRGCAFFWSKVGLYPKFAIPLKTFFLSLILTLTA